MANISLPIDDRRRTHDFYAHTFGVEAIGPEAEDGLPEPLRFDINGTAMLFIPKGGFNWALGDLELCGSGRVGALMVYGVSNDTDVDEVTQRAVEQGGTIVLAPSKQDWGIYAATFTDPDGNLWMTTSDPSAS